MRSEWYEIPSEYGRAARSNAWPEADPPGPLTLRTTIANIVLPWAASSFGRALPWHGRGEGFESLAVHHPPTLEQSSSCGGCPPKPVRAAGGFCFNCIVQGMRRVSEKVPRMAPWRNPGSGGAPRPDVAKARGRRNPLRSTKRCRRKDDLFCFRGAQGMRRAARGREPVSSSDEPSRYSSEAMRNPLRSAHPAPARYSPDVPTKNIHATEDRRPHDRRSFRPEIIRTNPAGYSTGGGNSPTVLPVSPSASLERRSDSFFSTC